MRVADGFMRNVPMAERDSRVRTKIPPLVLLSRHFSPAKSRDSPARHSEGRRPNAGCISNVTNAPCRSIIPLIQHNKQKLISV